MRILSYGDKITRGVYSHIHSSFTHAINFLRADNCVISLVTEKVGAGPYNIVVSENELSHLNHIELDDCIKINKQKFEINTTKKFISEFPEIKCEQIDKNIEIIPQILSDFAPQKSLAFLIFPEKSSEFTSSFDKAFKSIIEKSVNDIFENNDFVNGSKSIKGMGYGLTPSGDDFITGMLVALTLLGKKHNVSYIELKNKIYENALGENRISNNFLHIANADFCNQNLKNLLEALSNNDKNKIELYTKNYIDIGETSGADFLTGLYLMYEKNKECKIYN
jgi:hypothetical protein